MRNSSLVLMYILFIFNVLTLPTLQFWHIFNAIIYFKLLSPRTQMKKLCPGFQASPYYTVPLQLDLYHWWV